MDNSVAGASWSGSVLEEVAGGHRLVGTEWVDSS